MDHECGHVDGPPHDARQLRGAASGKLSESALVFASVEETMGERSLGFPPHDALQQRIVQDAANCANRFLHMGLLPALRDALPDQRNSFADRKAAMRQHANRQRVGLT